MKELKFVTYLRSDDEKIMKLISYFKARKRNKFISQTIINALKELKEEQLDEFVKPIFREEANKILKQLKMKGE